MRNPTSPDPAGCRAVQLGPLLRANVKDIIAMGVDRERTLIFSDFEYMGGAFYKNVIKM